ncbi:MAG TPA: hypothetical protein VEA60_13350 [Allosphingosinicella sp.]|nr:hypothetical protein [Allosphingosinicella sp.]
MPDYTFTDLPYAILGPGKVWVDSRSTFRADSLLKNTNPDSERQGHFHMQLLRLSNHLGTRRLPVFVNWPGAGRLRMDKGCIGHAVAAGFLNLPEDGPAGYITHVEIAGAAELV